MTIAAAAPRPSAAATKSWPSNCGPRQRDEQIARRDGAAVDRDAGRRASRAVARRRSPRPASAAVQSGVMRPPAARASDGVARDLGIVEGQGLAADDLAVSRGPCRRSPARRRRRDRAIAAAIARARSPISIAPWAQAARIARADRGGILAARIVVGDDDAVGEPLARSRPSAAACRGSRSPPQPNTTTSRPAACGRSAVSTVSSASGVWA